MTTSTWTWKITPKSCQCDRAVSDNCSVYISIIRNANWPNICYTPFLSGKTNSLTLDNLYLYMFMRLLIFPYLWRPGSRNIRTVWAPYGRCAFPCCSRTCSGHHQTAAGGLDTRCSSIGWGRGSPDSWAHTAGSLAPNGRTPWKESGLERFLVLHPAAHLPGITLPDTHTEASGSRTGMSSRNWFLGGWT